MLLLTGFLLASLSWNQPQTVAQVQQTSVSVDAFFRFDKAFSEGMSLGSQANTAYNQQDFAKARSLLQEAIGRLEEVIQIAPTLLPGQRSLFDNCQAPRAVNFLEVDRYCQAQQRIAEYRRALEQIDQQLGASDTYNTALQAATQAVIFGQNQQWQQAEQAWETAIRTLQTIPAQHPQYALAQQKIIEYRQNLTLIRGRMNQPTASSQYDAGISSARRAVEEGQQQNWQAALNWWDSAIKHMQAVPPGDPRYSQAQAKVREYRNNYNEIQKRIRLDAIAAAERERLRQQQTLRTTPSYSSSYSGGPRRAPRRGTCECPYDLDSAGRRCGGRSSYSRSGRGNCY